MSRAIGIDLGTTYSAVACVNEVGTPEILPNRDSERITPSIVMFQQGEVVVGAQARRSLVSDPEKVVQFVKRQMGNGAWRYDTDSGETYRPEEVSSLILRRLAEDAELALGEPVGPVVITVPAYFDDAQRKATVDAGSLAGLNVERVVNEPTAAAVAYGLHSGDEGTVLVYDLGGGTFDVTLLRISGRDFEVVATHGNPNLGGFDWDNALMEWVNAEFQKRGGPDLSNDLHLLADLRDKTEALKRNLSLRETGSIFLSAGGVNAKVAVTRQTFEDLTRELLNRTEATLELVQDDAGIDFQDIDRVLLVGGSTRMPMVRELVTRVTGKEPQRGFNPDEVVALGAAVIASMLESTTHAHVTVEDVTAHSLGMLALDQETKRERNFIIIGRNSSIPTRASENFSTTSDQQTELEVQITEGEDADPAYVKLIGTTLLKIPPYPVDAPIRVDMGYDIDGLIEVSVYDLTAHRELGRFEVDRTANMDVEEVARRSAELQGQVIF